LKPGRAAFEPCFRGERCYTFRMAKGPVFSGDLDPDIAALIGGNFEDVSSSQGTNGTPSAGALSRDAGARTRPASTTSSTTWTSRGARNREDPSPSTWQETLPRHQESRAGSAQPLLRGRRLLQERPLGRRGRSAGPPPGHPEVPPDPGPQGPGRHQAETHPELLELHAPPLAFMRQARFRPVQADDHALRLHPPEPPLPRAARHPRARRPQERTRRAGPLRRRMGQARRLRPAQGIGHGRSAPLADGRPYQVPDPRFQGPGQAGLRRGNPQGEGRGTAGPRAGPQGEGGFRHYARLPARHAPHPAPYTDPRKRPSPRSRTSSAASPPRIASSRRASPTSRTRTRR